MKDMRGTTAVVTGASRGIGVHIARALVREGVNLSLAARSEEELEVVRKEMASLGVKAIATRCDVTSAEDRATLIDRTQAELGPIDILINNAGIETVSRFHEAEEDDLVRTLEVNLVAAMLLTRAVLAGMLDRQRGHIVNIASGAGQGRRVLRGCVCDQQARHGRADQFAPMRIPQKPRRILRGVPGFCHRDRHVCPLGE